MGNILSVLLIKANLNKSHFSKIVENPAKGPNSNAFSH
jgi:hypothetical protein